MSVTSVYGTIRHPFGLPAGTVRGFMSILICSFFWITLLLPEQHAFTAPIAHFVLFFLVFSAFVSHPVQDIKSPFLPWLMRLIFVGGSMAVLGYVILNHADRVSERLTPSAGDIKSWPVLCGVMILGFGLGIFSRFLMGRNSELYQTIRGWVGVIATLLLIAETVFQFAIRPSLSVPPSDEAMQIWESIIIGFVSAYFGTRS